MKIEFELVEIPESDLPEYHHEPSPWFSPSRSSFLLWTTRKVWELPLSGDHAPRPVELGSSDRIEFLDSRRDGFRYFAVDQEDVFSGFNPQRDQAPVEHRFSDKILVCDNRTIRRWDREGRELEKKSVPKPITAKTAAKQHPWIFVGDNNGDVRRLTLEREQLGRLEKITTTKPAVRDLLLTDNDENLFVAGMGELQKLTLHDHRYQTVSSIETATREMLVLNEALILLSRGIHSLQVIDKELKIVLDQKPPFSIERICPADDGGTVLATSQMYPYRQFALISLKR